MTKDQKVSCIHPRKYRQIDVQYGGDKLIMTEICSLCNQMLGTKIK